MKRIIFLRSREVLYTFVFRQLLLYEWRLLWCVHLHDDKIIKVHTLVLAALCQWLFDLWQYCLHRLKVDILSYRLVYINEYNWFWCYSPLLFDICRSSCVCVCVTQHSVSLCQIFIYSVHGHVSRLAHTSMDKAYNSGVSIHACPFEALFMGMSSTYCIDPIKENLSLFCQDVCLYFLYCKFYLEWSDVGC